MGEPIPPADVVIIVDDDPSIRAALSSLFRSVDLQVQSFGSTQALLGAAFPDAAACLVLDIQLPGVSGLDLQLRLQAAGILVPIVFMTGYGDIPMSVQAMRAGAVDFLPKPFSDDAMLQAVRRALDQDRARRSRSRASAALLGLFQTLTPREQEVMTLVTTGMMNKQVAGRLGLSEITVKIHRGNAMRKMGAQSLADMVRMAETLQLHRPTRAAWEAATEDSRGSPSVRITTSRSG
jgi:FixJ family two-component response regulator